MFHNLWLLNEQILLRKCGGVRKSCSQALGKNSGCSFVQVLAPTVGIRWGNNKKGGDNQEGKPICGQSNFNRFRNIGSTNNTDRNGAREGKCIHHCGSFQACRQVDFRHSHCELDLRNKLNEKNSVEEREWREQLTEVSAKAVRMAARIDPTSAERGGREPRNTRSNCTRQTSSAKGRENVRVPVDANLTNTW